MELRKVGEGIILLDAASDALLCLSPHDECTTQHEEGCPTCGPTANVATTTPLITTTQVGMHSPLCTLTTPGIPAGGSRSHKEKEDIAKVVRTVDEDPLMHHGDQMLGVDHELVEFHVELPTTTRYAKRHNGMEYGCASNLCPPCRAAHAATISAP